MRTFEKRSQVGTPISKRRGWNDRMGTKVKPPKKSLGLPTKPKKSLDQKLAPKKSHVELPSLEIKNIRN